MKHNKKRNTVFIYEALSRQLTKAILESDTQQKNKIVSIVKDHFSVKSVLAEELELYQVLLETANIQENIAERMLKEAKLAYSKLDGKSVFDAQSKLIAAINKGLTQNVWANFVPNFKSLASVNAIFNDKMPVKNRVLFEQAIIDRMSAPKKSSTHNSLQSVDNLTYHSFIKKFNDKYGTLLQEQKDLLNQFITSFADDGFELRLYLNEELSRLKNLVRTATTTTQEALVSQKLAGVTEYLEEFRKREFTDTDLNKILKTQQLVRELAAND
jgi:hypothetical protein